jgi:TolB protein
MKITRLTDSGKVTFANISPNGKYVGYVVTEGSKGRFWLREVGKTSETEVVLPDEVEFWSGSITFTPDSESICITAKPINQEYFTAYQMSLGGGVVKRLPIDAVTLNFSPDGKRIAYWRNDMSTGVTSILVANADGTDERELISRQAPSYFGTSSMSWSPDGKMIACIGQTASDGYNAVVGVNVEDGTEKRLTPQRWNDIRAVTWLPDMSGLVMTAADLTATDLQVWHVSYPGGEARKITNDLSSYGTGGSNNVGITADGNALVTIQEEKQFRIWTVPVKYNGSTTNAAPRLSVDMRSARQIINISNAILGHRWTPDGRLVYSTVENGYADLWIIDADGSNRKQLTNDAYIDGFPSVSPDGHYIVFWSRREGNQHIWRIDIDGKNLKQLTDGRVEADPVCSPAGKWVYYNSWDTGKATIWRVQIEGGEPEQLTETNSFTPSPSPDGSVIEFFPTGPGFSIMRSEGGQPIKTLTFQNLPVALANPPLWTPDGRALTCMAHSGGSDGIWLIPIDGGRAEKLIDFKPDMLWYYDWSSDWKQLAFARGTAIWNVVLITDVK